MRGGVSKVNSKLKFTFIFVTIGLMVALPLSGAVQKVENVHTLVLNTSYADIRNRSLLNGTPQSESTIELYFPANTSISGFGTFELAIIPSFYWDPQTLVLNASQQGPIPGTFVNIILLAANYTSYGALGFKVVGMNISSSTFTIPEIGKPYLVRYSQMGGFGQTRQIGPNFLLDASAPGYPQLNISIVPNGIYYLHLTLDLYRVIFGIFTFEETDVISIPYMTVVR